MTINTQILDSLGLSQQSQQTKNAANPNQIGQSAFLKLMITQLNNQDPTKPMDSGQFYTQIAQFSAVSGIEDLQNSFAQVATAMYSSQALQASAMVGRAVLVPAQNSTLEPGGVIAGTVDVPEAVNNVRVGIYDTVGQLVRTLDLGPQAAGSASFVWDGMDANGKPMPPGLYHVAAETLVAGQSQALNTSLAARVDSVSLGKGGAGITLNLSGVGPVALADVKQVM
jgi:flagellar basal-body rod modification protein FlgD